MLGQPAVTESATEAWRSLGLRPVLAALLVGACVASDLLLGLPVVWSVAGAALVALVLFELVERRRPTRRPVLGTLFDMSALAVALAASGGAANPFTALFFVHVAVAASALPRRAAFGVAAFGAAAFGALFAAPAPPACHVDATAAAFERHLWGMWAAWAVAAGLVTLALTRARALLASRDRELERLRDESEAAARFAAIGTLAAGAAHELGTPLGTIAIVARELQGRPLDEADHASAVAIADQVDRCRAVLRRMQAGGATGARGALGAPLGATVRDAVAAFEAAHPGARVELHVEHDSVVDLAPTDVASAVDVLLDNAWAASLQVGATAPIEVAVQRGESHGAVLVRDRGVGLGAVAPARLGEPFLTTKPVGQGMGLGLYIVRRAVEGAGGRLSVRGRVGGGAEAELQIRARRAGAVRAEDGREGARPA